MKKAALVTGGAVRIGAGMALKLAGMGYDIALHYNNSQTEAEKIKREVEKKGTKCKLFKSDFSIETEVTGLIEEVSNEFEELTLLINNASIFERFKITETTLELFEKTFNINFKTPFILSRDFAKLVEKGNIINVLDTKAIKNSYFYAAYTLSKKSLLEFTKMAANEFGPDIRVNAIAPGLILEPEGKTSEYLDKMAENIPLKKRGSLEEINNALEFILLNGYVTGQIIFVDGGQHL